MPLLNVTLAVFGGVVGLVVIGLFFTYVGAIRRHWRAIAVFLLLLAVVLCMAVLIGSAWSIGDRQYAARLVVLTLVVCGTLWFLLMFPAPKKPDTRPGFKYSLGNEDPNNGIIGRNASRGDYGSSDPDSPI